MREILFRGKRLDNGKWVSGSFCMDARELLKGLCGVDGFIRRYEPNKGQVQMYEVDRQTVGQFTGLTDKNDTRIFEGDILRASVREMKDAESEVFGRVKLFTGNKIEALWTVEWKNFSGYTGFRVYGKDRRFNRPLSLNLIINCDVEVIGNIHDNPELIGERKDNGKIDQE